VEAAGQAAAYRGAAGIPGNGGACEAPLSAAKRRRGDKSKHCLGSQPRLRWKAESAQVPLY